MGKIDKKVLRSRYPAPPGRLILSQTGSGPPKMGDLQVPGPLIYDRRRPYHRARHR